MRGRASGRTNTKGAVPRGNSPFVIYLLSNLPVENRLCLVVCGIVTEQVGADHGAEECSEHADDEVDEAFADEQREAQDANGAACQCSSVAGTCDAAVIDSLMAAAMVGEGTSYENLTYTVQLNSEEYGVGFRTGSDLADALNEFFKAAYKDGSLLKTAETYGVQAALIEQK